MNINNTLEEQYGYEANTDNDASSAMDEVLVLLEQHLPIASAQGTALHYLPELEVSLQKSANLCTVDTAVRRADDSANGRNPRPAELGSIEAIQELLQSGNFQNADGSLTQSARDAIRAAIGNTPWWSTYESRTQFVQDRINRHAFPPITLTFDRDAASANTRIGSQPSILVGTPAGTTRILMRR